MDILNKKISKKEERPVKVIQFGEGNFLRAFADHMIDIANEKGCFDGDIVIVKPREGSLETFRRQECQYTVCMRGITEGKAQKTGRIVTAVSDAVESVSEYDRFMNLAKLDSIRFVISNTTEAGIVYEPSDHFEMKPPVSFPGKLCKFLYERWKAFDGAVDKGLIMLPTELIDENGKRLKECVLRLAKDWNLGASFETWIEEACIFASTLVDRIVSGFPAEEVPELFEELGYRDELLVTGEPFGLWVIESNRDFREEFALDKAGLPVLYTNDLKPYKNRKVRILNGAHTSFVLASYLSGKNIVLESMQDGTTNAFIRKTIYEEVIPTLDLPGSELSDFAEAVFTRFQNPYVKHALLAISMNSVSKWRARCLPSLVAYYEKYGKIPSCLAFSIAALMAFYTGSEICEGVLIGHRLDEEYPIRDDVQVLEFFAQQSGKTPEEYARAVLCNASFWGRDLTEIPDLLTVVADYLRMIRECGTSACMKGIVE